jgi:hypothetical protein
MNTALMIFLILLIAAFVIVFVIMGVGYFRTRSYKGKASTSTPEPAIKTSRENMENRLASPELHKKGLDPRGDDIGGNFSGISNRKDTSGENRR